MGCWKMGRSEMAGEKQGAVWPMPKFFFRVSMEDMQFTCQEVSGLDAENDEIEYRAGNGKAFSTVKMPGLRKPSNVTCKKLLMAGDHGFWDWFSEINMNTIRRRAVKIELLDEIGAAAMTWTLSNAWPTKVTGADLKSAGNAVAIEAIEFVHEGIVAADG